MLSKERFITIIERLVEANDIVKQVNEIFQNSSENIRDDFCNASSLSISNEDSVIELLEVIFDDLENGLLRHWVYEVDYGKKIEEIPITEKNGTLLIPMSASDLYDLLLRYMGE
jgi:hypothetical protein